MRYWDWDGMVEANRRRLLRLLAGLLALLGSGGTVTRAIRRRAVAALVPMEAAARRLAFVLARDLDATLPPARGGGIRARDRGRRAPVFALVDPPRRPGPPSPPRTGCHAPRVLFLDEGTARPALPVPSDADPVDATALRRRAAALEAALGDLPAQARRLARWQARGARARAAGTWRRVHPLRLGRPPGRRRRDPRPAHGVLADCHALAMRCLRMLEAERRAG